MFNVWLSIALIAVFIAIGGVFAAAEMALVSLRDTQVKQLATKGSRGKKVAGLTANPNRFLSAIQICITFTGFLSASFGAASLAHHLAPLFTGWGLPDGVAQVIALIVMTLIISYFSVVIGELAAKRLAMQRAESVALGLSGFIDGVARLARPIVWFLGLSTDVVVRLLGGDPKAARQVVTPEEFRTMVVTSASLSEVERAIVDEVLSAGERNLREVMVPRTEVEFLSGDLAAHAALRQMETATHSRFPVTGSSVDDVLGFIHIRDLMYLPVADRSTPIRRLVRPMASIPATVKVLHALTQMRRNDWQIVLVSDEYGGTAGIITLEDLVEELIGDITDEYDVKTPGVVASAGEIEVDGLMTLDQFEDLTGLVIPEGPYNTLAGFWVACRGALPGLGDVVEATLRGSDEVDEAVGTPVSLTVTAMDGRRADRIKLTQVSTG